MKEQNPFLPEDPMRKLIELHKKTMDAHADTEPNHVNVYINGVANTFALFDGEIKIVSQPLQIPPIAMTAAKEKALEFFNKRNQAGEERAA